MNMELYPSEERLPQVNESDLTAIVSSTADLDTRAHQVASAIHTPETAHLAVVWCQDRMTEIDAIENKYAVLRDFLHRSHKAVTSRIASLVNPRKDSIAVVKDAIRAWTWYENEQRVAMEMRLAQEAKQREEDQRLAAAEAMAKDNPTLAEALLNGPPLTPPPVVPKAELKGATTTKRWGVKVSNKRELIKGIAGGAVPENAVDVDLTWLKRQATLLNGNMPYPGIEVYPDDGINIRRG